MARTSQTKGRKSVDFFGAAQEAPARKRTKKDKREIRTPGLLALASIVAVEKILKPLKNQAEEEVKDFMANEFVKVGMEIKDRPANMRGIDDNCSASLQLRKRSFSSSLDETQLAFLEDHNIDTEKVTEFYFNPVHLTPEIMALVTHALNQAPEIPKDLFLKKEKVVVTEDSLKQIFKSEQPDNVVKSLLDVAATLSVTPKIEGEEFNQTIERVGEMLEAAHAEEAQTVM